VSAERPDVEAELGRLKGFQRQAAEYAFERLFRAADSTGRFLVADEVGLGKTLIARGITALAIDHLWQTVQRIDVVYVCSNGAIARQNVRRLGFEKVAVVNRLTLLPVTIQALASAKLNFVALTPGTSLDPRSNLGIEPERRLIYHLMQRLWRVEGSGPMNLLQGNVRDRGRWRRSLREFLEERTISPELQRSIHALLEVVDADERAAGKPGLRARWESACAEFRHARAKWPPALARLRGELVGELRAHVARACIDAIEPDLVILDEFQRFKHLLDPEEGDEAGELARRLFEWSGDATEARVLLLSATPYKMYTLAHEAAEDDHFADFLRTVGFLQRDADRTAYLRGLLERYRRGLLRLADDGGDAALGACREVEAELRRVMSRNERTGATGRGDGMVRTVASQACTVSPRELVDFVPLAALATEFGARNVLEHWKSAPYVLSLSEDYDLDRSLEAAVEAATSERIDGLLDAARGSFLDPEDVQAYRRIDPANARMRGLFADVVDSGLWRCLWLPPTSPSYEPSGAYAQACGATKRLVFSAWAVVPRAIASLVSYEVERLALLEEDPSTTNTAEARERRRPLLRFASAQDRLTGMPLLGLLYPSRVLGDLGDPRRRARENGRKLDRDTLLVQIEADVRRLLDPRLLKAPDDGPVDESWYWAAPILLDVDHDPAARAFWASPMLAATWSRMEGEEEATSDDSDGWWAAHVDEARRLVRGELALGRPPEDLAALMARIAVAAPATAALRGLGRVLADGATSDSAPRLAAAQIGWGFRTLFNRPESTAIVRRAERDVPLWRMILDHCVDGCLGDVLDEHLHLLRDFEGLFDAPAEVAAPVLARAVREATGIRTTRTGCRVVAAADGRPSFDRMNLRGHFALGFGASKTEEGAGAMRPDQVRAAFNSPFWPFVLASTSVGQEGLDFHPWCHAVVHWNLPTNPVDLEQREGRVHRFKGHAVRKNVALRYGEPELLDPTNRDPWAGLFERASQGCADDRGGLVPYWVFEADGGAHIERHVPAPACSTDLLRFEALQRSLALYRMVFGQPRQDDLMAFLLRRVPQHVLDRLLEQLRVDLRPAGVSRSRETAGRAGRERET
jgi:hypothetical protein